LVGATDPELETTGATTVAETDTPHIRVSRIKIRFTPGNMFFPVFVT